MNIRVLSSLKSVILNLFLWMICLSLFSTSLEAQVFTTIHSYAALLASDFVLYTNSDGANPTAGLISDGKSFYGVASLGGSFESGVVFRIDPNGKNFTNLYNFTVIPGATPFANEDGAYPTGSLLLVSSNVLYGTARGGGTFGYGTVFTINTDGTHFTNLYNFSGGIDGGRPYCPLISAGDVLYGTASSGGVAGNGVLFRIDQDGGHFTNFYSFTANDSSNNDGAFPVGGLILSSNILYGTAAYGGKWGQGTVFAVNPDGSGFTTLYSFTGGKDGGWPIAGLISSGGILFGTTSLGNGGIFAIGTNGIGFTNLYSFTGAGDGANPYDGLVLSGATLYGTVAGGTSSGNGTVFAIGTNGVNFNVIHSFTSLISGTNSDGAQPRGALIVSNGSLYGTTLWGGNFGNGAIFSITLPRPELGISVSGANVVLTWPPSATGFTLQSTTNIAPTSSWITINGQNTVTNPISGAQQFYRLIQ